MSFLAMGKITVDDNQMEHLLIDGIINNASKPFDTPSEEENKIIEKAKKKKNINIDENMLEIGYMIQGNFVVCICKFLVVSFYGDSYSLQLGVAKRNPNADEYNLKRVKEIVLYRALTNFFPLTLLT